MTSVKWDSHSSNVESARTSSVSFRTSDDFRLAGLITLPKKLNGIVLLAHGMMVGKDEYGGLYAELAVRLAQIGFASLRFDFRGHGDSSGTARDISVLNEVLDTKAAYRYLAAHFRLPIDCVATSFGAPPTKIVRGGGFSSF